MSFVKITVNCKTLTPTIASGANPYRFELRASAVKVGLRFWWRAFQPLEGTALYNAEKQLFGGTEQACPFYLRLSVDANSLQLWEMGNIVASPDETQYPWGEGIGYFLYPMYAQRCRNPRIERPHIKIKQHRNGSIDKEKSGRPVARPGLKFRIILSVIGKEALKQAGELICALWLLENLGGLGARCRRGAGSFAIEQIQKDPNTNMPDYDGPLPEFDKSCFESPAKFVAAGIKVARERWMDGHAAAPPPTYTAFRSGSSEIWVFHKPKEGKGTGTGAMKAMDALGRQMKKFRLRNPWNEARDMHHALSGESTSLPGFAVLEKAQLGLPIMYNFRPRGQFGTFGRPGGGSYEAKGVVWDSSTNEADTGNKQNAERRASPLLISCHEFNGTAYAVLCHFPAPILPPGQRIWLKSSTGCHDFFPSPPVGHDFVDALLTRGVQVNGQPRQPLSDAFDYKKAVEKRPSKVTTTASPFHKTPIPPKSKTVPIPDKPEAWMLTEARKRPDGLTWYLAQIAGSASGTGKKQTWPCRLWTLESGKFTSVPGKFVVRNKLLMEIPNLKISQDTLFLCTLQADTQTQPHGEYLYNIEKLPTL